MLPAIISFEKTVTDIEIGNYLIVEVGIKKLLGEMMRIAH